MAASQTVTLARNAMATRFELVLHGSDATALRAAGEEAFNEVDRLENRLSLYRSGSEIAQINARAAQEPVQVSPEVFTLLQHAAKLSQETAGAFDITIAPLVRCWGFMGANGKLPEPEAVAAAQALVGMSQVELDARRRTVRFIRNGVMLDLGAIGKGYAVGCCADILREAGVTSALIHGGTSTAYALGHPPDAESWRVGIESPPGSWGRGETGLLEAFKHEFQLCDEAMSVSAVWGRWFADSEKKFGHVIDPRTGQPVNATLLAVVVLPLATETDALSTALLTVGAEGHDKIVSLRPGMRTLLVRQEGRGLHSESRGV